MKPQVEKNCLLFALTSLVFLLPNISLAEEILSPSGFSVEPAISKVSVVSGAQIKSGFTVKNTGKENVVFTVRVVDFMPGDNYGGVKEIISSGDKEDPILASGWISVPNEPITLPPKQKISIPYSITVPIDAGPGGRSLSFIVESASGNVHSRVNALCFLTIPGNASESLELVDFSFSPKISSNVEGNIHLELRNTGKTHINPEGKLIIRNMFGVIRGVYPLTQSLSLGTIIPAAKRSTDYKWKGSGGIFDFGIWNAKIELDYGIKNDNFISNITFFVLLPWKALLFTIIILGGSIFLFLSSVKKLRKDISILKSTENIDEKSISLKLLIIPFVAGLLLLVVLIVSIYSIVEYRGEGALNKVNIEAMK